MKLALFPHALRKRSTSEKILNKQGNEEGNSKDEHISLGCSKRTIVEMCEEFGKKDIKRKKLLKYNYREFLERKYISIYNNQKKIIFHYSKYTHVCFNFKIKENHNNTCIQ